MAVRHSGRLTGSPDWLILLSMSSKFRPDGGRGAASVALANDRRTRVMGAAAAVSVAVLISAVGLVLNELTGQSLILFRYVAIVGPTSVALLGYVLTPALISRRRVAGLDAVWGMTLGTLLLGIALVAALMSFTGLPEPHSPMEPVIWTAVIFFAGVLYTGIPMLVLIFPCAVLWARVTRRLSRRAAGREVPSTSAAS